MSPIDAASPFCASRTVTSGTSGTEAHYLSSYAVTVTQPAVPDLETLHRIGAAQQPSWPDRAALDAAVARLRGVPPLVFAGGGDGRNGRLAAVARGDAF